MAKDKKKPQSAGDPGGRIAFADIADKLTINGRPVFDDIKIDPDTGDLLSYTLQPETKEELEAQAAAAAGLGVEAAQRLTTLINGIIGGADIKQITVTLQEWHAMLKAVYDDAEAGQALLEELRELRPYLDAELKRADYSAEDFNDIARRYTLGELLDLLRDPGSEFAQIMDAARDARDTIEAAKVKRADIIEYPLDKPNSYIWNLLEKDTGGQIKFDMLPKQAQLQATAIYSINFDELSNDLQITKRLTPFDKRVYIAVSALFNAGNTVITLTQIYYAMGYTGKPNTRDLNRINDAITKMNGAKILFDNQHEADALNRIKRFKYDGSLLPIERLTAIVNGRLTDAAIRLFREPPLMSFAKQRQQITTISVKLLQSPVNKTDANLQIDDYLIERISKAKNGSARSCRILYKTLYERTGIKDKKQRQRAPAKIQRYLDYYQQQEFITNYTLQADGITVYF